MPHNFQMPESRNVVIFSFFCSDVHTNGRQMGAGTIPQQHMPFDLLLPACSWGVTCSLWAHQSKTVFQNLAAPRQCLPCVLLKILAPV